jgi:hypothetical protein
VKILHRIKHTVKVIHGTILIPQEFVSTVK